MANAYYIKPCFSGQDRIVANIFNLHCMHHYKLLLALFLFTSQFLSAQDTLNRVNSAGQRYGPWVLYLDRDWNKVSDSSQALFYRYTYYENDINIYPMGRCGGKGYRLEGTVDSTGCLHGEYKWYDAKGRLSSVHLFSYGTYISCKEYYPTGELHQHFDYTLKANGQEHGWTIFIYSKDGKLKARSVIGKDKNGKWPPLRG